MANLKMSEALLYSENSQHNSKDAKIFLEKYLHFIQWREDGADSLVDAGCGAGDITVQLLLPKLSNNFNKMIGLDISPEMVELARTKWQHPKISFAEFDLATKNFPEEHQDAFDHVFSFYCFHFIPDQRQALINVRKMLKKNGDCFITQVVNAAVFDVFQTLAKSTKWGRFMKNVRDAISPYHKMKEPNLIFEKLLNESGFFCKVCQFVDRAHYFSSWDQFKNFVRSLNMFFKRIPDDLKKDYLMDYMNEFKKFGVVPTEEGKVPFCYQVIIAVASKID